MWFVYVAGLVAFFTLNEVIYQKFTKRKKPPRRPI